MDCPTCNRNQSQYLKIKEENKVLREGIESFLECINLPKDTRAILESVLNKVKK
jgi:hypothetical protein